MDISKSEKIWNLVSMLVFVLCLVAVGILLDFREIRITDINVFDLLIICLATYRMTRLVVYDRIFKLFRDIMRSFSGTGIGDSVKTIVTCPWCAGVWLALFSVAVFYLVPFGKLFVYVIAISGIATIFQISANILGLFAEEKQMDVREKRRRHGRTKV